MKSVLVRKSMFRPKKVLSLLLFLAPLACESISPFSPAAYERATSLKVEALFLMDRATESYAEHKQEAAALEIDLAKAYEFAKGRPKNEITEKQWEILKDPERNLLGGFLARWKSRSKLPAVFVEEAKKLVGDAFDSIIRLESGKPVSPEGK